MVDKDNGVSKNRYIEGLRFGMLLQLAIGPMCLMVFNTAKNEGFISGFVLALAVTLVDVFYVVLAGFGASKLLEKEGAAKVCGIVGGVVLVLFGINIILNVYGINIIPGLSIQADRGGIFVQGLILTLSNPLTIVFWGSVLTGKIVEDDLKKTELVQFQAGCVSSTIIFMSLVAALGTFLKSFIPQQISDVLNVVVGVLIIFFGLKMTWKTIKK